MLGEALSLLKNIFPSDDIEAIRDVSTVKDELLSVSQIARSEHVIPKDINSATNALLDSEKPDWNKARIFICGPKDENEMNIYRQENPEGSGKGAIADLEDIIEKRKNLEIGEEEEAMVANSLNWYKKSGFWETMGKDVSEFVPGKLIPGFQGGEKPSAMQSIIQNAISSLKQLISGKEPYEQRGIVETFFKDHSNLKRVKDNIIDALGFPKQVSERLKTFVASSQGNKIMVNWYKSTRENIRAER